MGDNTSSCTSFWRSLGSGCDVHEATSKTQCWYSGSVIRRTQHIPHPNRDDSQFSANHCDVKWPKWFETTHACSLSLGKINEWHTARSRTTVLTMTIFTLKRDIDCLRKWSYFSGNRGIATICSHCKYTKNGFPMVYQYLQLETWFWLQRIINDLYNGN